MKKYYDIVDKVIKSSDILLIVADARKAKESINEKVENWIKKQNKKFLYVINKIDLISKSEQDKIHIPNSVEVSAKKHMNTTNLLKKIMEVGKGKEVTVGVVGFPNTGKSTLINALKGKRSAPASAVSGYTKGLQKLRISSKILMIDTPGVFSYDKKEFIDNIIIGAIDADKVENPEDTASELIDALKGKVEKYYDVEKNYDSYDTLENIAIKKKLLRKGNLPDTKRTGKEIIRLWQTGKIR